MGSYKRSTSPISTASNISRSSPGHDSNYSRYILIICLYGARFFLKYDTNHFFNAFLLKFLFSCLSATIIRFIKFFLPNYFRQLSNKYFKQMFLWFGFCEVLVLRVSFCSIYFRPFMRENPKPSSARPVSDGYALGKTDWSSDDLVSNLIHMN